MFMTPRSPRSSWSKEPCSYLLIPTTNFFLLKSAWVLPHKCEKTSCWPCYLSAPTRCLPGVDFMEGLQESGTACLAPRWQETLGKIIPNNTGMIAIILNCAIISLPTLSWRQKRWTSTKKVADVFFLPSPSCLTADRNHWHTTALPSTAQCRG